MIESKVLMLLMERGEIIISEVSFEQTKHGLATFITFAVILVERGPHGVLGFMLSAWLPSELMTNTHIILDSRLLTGTMVPNPEMVSFYTAWAKTERDKMKSFGKDFTAQIQAIEKYHVDKYHSSKHRQKKDIFISSPEVSPEVIALFEDENGGWGDPSISN